MINKETFKGFCVKNKKKLIAFGIAAVVIPLAITLGMKQFDNTESETILKVLQDSIGNTTDEDSIESGDETPTEEA